MAFRWFNTPGQFSPSSMEDYVSGKGSAYGYQSPQEGALSILGKTLSGVGAAFAGDTQYNQRQQQIEQEQYQADLEWRAALARQQMDREQAMRPVYSFDPVSGEYSLKGEVPKGTVIRNVAPPLEYQMKKAELTGMASILPKMDQAKEAVNILKDQFYAALSPQSVEKGDIKGGAGARFSGIGKAAEAAIGASPDLQAFKNNRGAFASLISKGGFLEAGVLTNQDIERVLKAVPNEFSTKQEAEKGWGTVDNILSAARNRYEKSLSGVTNKSEPNQQGWTDAKQARLEELRKKLGK